MGLASFAVFLTISIVTQVNGAVEDAKYINLAFDQLTSQISTKSSFYSRYAVDGNADNNSLCAQTLDEDDSWWQVQLANTKKIGKVKINNEFSCCQESFNISVYVAQNGDRDNATLCYFDEDFKDGQTIYKPCMHGPVTGDTVVVIASGHTSLKICELEVYEAIDGNWNQWSDWSQCLGQCEKPYTFRTRQCDAPTPSNDGVMCAGEDSEKKTCIRADCPVVNGSWSNWGEGTCSATCGEGTAERTRYCNNPPPSSGGFGCEGESKDEVICKMSACPVFPALMSGLPEDMCVRHPCMNGGTCTVIGDGRRRCVCPQSIGGDDCQYVMTASEWGVWGEWSAGSCTVTCGDGTEYNVRKCNSQSPYSEGTECQGANTRAKPCKMMPCAAGLDEGTGSGLTASKILMPVAMTAIVVGPLLALLVFGLYMSRRRFRNPGNEVRGTDELYEENLLKTRLGKPGFSENASMNTTKAVRGDSSTLAKFAANEHKFVD